MTDSLRSNPTRLPLAAGVALTTTFGLFWVMQALVATERTLPDPEPFLRVDIVRLKKDPPPPPPEPRRKHRKPQPAPLPPPLGAPTKGIEDVFALPPAPKGAETWQGDDLLQGASQSLTPLVRVDPEYPPRAEQRGIAGWVELAFTVTASGHVEGARVIRSRPPEIFDASALRAVQRWRYRPRLENGRPVPATDQRIRIHFEPGGS